MNFLCRKPRHDASTGAFDLRHRPTDTTNTPPRRHDDASISMSSWANIDTEKASRNSFSAGTVGIRRASDSKINYDHHHQSSCYKSNSKSRHHRQARTAAPPPAAARSHKAKSPDDASISMSSWANISVGKICENDIGQDRLFHSDSAIRYDGPTDIMVAPKPTTAIGGAENLPGSIQPVSGHHSRQTSWGNVDVLGMLSDIDKAREKAANDILERREASERRKSGSRRMTTTAPISARNTGNGHLGKPPVARPPQRKDRRPPLSGSTNRGTTSQRTRTQRV